MMYFNQNELNFHDKYNVHDCLYELLDICSIIRSHQLEICFFEKFWEISIGDILLKEYLYSLNDSDIVKTTILSIMNTGPWYTVEELLDDVHIQPDISQCGEFLSRLLESCYISKIQYIISLSNERELDMERYRIFASNQIHFVDNFIGRFEVEKNISSICSCEFNSMSECFNFIQDVSNGKIIFLTSAYKSAEQHEFTVRYNVIYDLITELLNVELENSFDKKSKFKGKTGYDISDESEATLCVPRYMREREFFIPDIGKKIFSWHIKIANFTRIHYYMDRENQTIYIGHCGKHLGTVSHRS